jgi:hypothetical protein
MDAKVLTLPPKAIAGHIGPTFREFLANAPALAPMLQTRAHEIRIPWDTQDFLINYPDVLHWVIVLSEETPETVVVVPILVRIAQLSSRFTLQIMRDSEAQNLLGGLATELELNGDLSEVDLPLLLIFDEEWEFQSQWGPHPEAAERYLDEWFGRHPEYETLAESEALADQETYNALLDKLTHEMRVWYNSGLNKACIREIHTLLASLLDEGDEDDADVRT